MRVCQWSATTMSMPAGMQMPERLPVICANWCPRLSRTQSRAIERGREQESERKSGRKEGEKRRGLVEAIDCTSVTLLNRNS